MANWLLLLTVHALVAWVAATDATTLCADALSSWTFENFNTCQGMPIRVDRGNGIIDLSTWSDTQLTAIFSKKELFGGFTISNSSITGKGVFFTIGSTEENASIIIENNPKLEEIFIERTAKSPIYLRVSGNRQLKKKYVIMLNDLKVNQEIRNDSYIQAYQECNLNGTTVHDVKSELANCSAIYGDLIFDRTTVFPQNDNDWKSIHPLDYVEGCLRITGTMLPSWDNITFLQETVGLKRCVLEISQNPNMCIHPALAYKLERDFLGMTIANNQPCAPECTSGYLHQAPSNTCVIITDSLIIDDKTTGEVLGALANVEEIRGNLQITNTTVTDFNYLPKLQKLNTDKIDSGAVISLQLNHQLKSFDLPLLREPGLFLGRRGQLKFNNDQNKKLTIEPGFFQRIGAKDADKFVVTVGTTTQAMTTTGMATGPTVKPIALITVFNTHGPLLLVGTILLVITVVVIFIIITYWISFWHFSTKWEWYSMGEEVDQTDIYKYDTESEWHMMARKMIDESRPKIEKKNLEHKQNTGHKELTFYNHMARRIMPGIFQEEDYKMRKHFGEKAFECDTVNYPAGEDGIYGLAFEQKAGYPEQPLYRTQCDKYDYLWFKFGLPPVYPESFETTAKLMARIPCDHISERIKYMQEQDIPIGEFGITGQEFKPAVTVDENDPVPSRAKKEERRLFMLGELIPKFKIHRYREKLNTLKISGKKFYWIGSKNLDKFVCRLAEALMNLPMKQNLQLTVSDVKHFLKVIQPDLFKAKYYTKKYPRAKMSVGEYVTPLNKTHVRIVGEIRGDFDALRRAINIPSLLDGNEHPLLQYNWVFLGNYTGRHPQSLETLLFLLSLQFLYGRDCIVLLRGIMEFKDTSEKYGFKDNLMDRFGPKSGLKVWNWLMTAMSRLPLNCQVLYSTYCSSGGFTEADVLEKIGRGPLGSRVPPTSPICHESTTKPELDKLFSLPNVTVRDYLENADTGAGYYYGERVLEKLKSETEVDTFFSTMPMMGGVGFFSDSTAVQLITISSVRHLHGHGGQKTLLPAVAEINAATSAMTMHMILHEDEMFHYDQKTGELLDVQGRTPSTTSKISMEGVGTMSKENTAKKTEDEKPTSKISAESTTKKTI